MHRGIVWLFAAISMAAGCGASERIAVSDADDLRAALRFAEPGQIIELEPGVYQGPFRMSEGASGTPESPVIIRPAAGTGRVVLDGNGTSITLKFSAVSHVTITGVDVTGGGYHGIFFDKGAHNITIEDSRIYDNHRTHPLNSHAEIKGSGADDRNRPRQIVLRNNEIFHTSHPPGGNFQGIDCNRCDDFHVTGNHIHSIHSPTEQPTSYYDRGACIQMKSLSRRTVIERNRIEDCHIGIVFGGEGMETPEHLGGAVRNNIIAGSHDIAIVLADVEDGVVAHNTLIGNTRSILLGTHRGRPTAENNAIIANNLIDQPIEPVKAAETRLENNLLISAEDAASWFAAASTGDVRLTAAATAAIDHAVPLDPPLIADFEGTTRPQDAAPDIGAFEYRRVLD